MLNNKIGYFSPLCFLPSGKLVCYQYGDIVIFNEGHIEKRLRVFDTYKERFIGRFNLLYRLFRLGIRSAIALDEKNIIISIGNSLYELNIELGCLSGGYFCGKGIRPLSFSNLTGISNIEDGIYFGEYLGNSAKNPVHIYKRNNIDEWKSVFQFKKGDINHIHAILADKYRDCVWIFTGDFDSSSAIWKATDNFNKVERFAYNNQKYRACSVFVIPEGILYATDAPFENNYIYLMNTKTSEVIPIKNIDGSCIYSCKWNNDFIFSSTVEGDGRNMSKLEFLFSRKRGSGIKDKYVHLYKGNLKSGFFDIYKEKKDIFPLYTFQFGAFKFPHGDNNGKALYFQPVATSKNDLRLLEYVDD